MNEREFGTCEICKKETYLQRTYFRYDIKCECHSPKHFEIVFHCKDCTPIEPKETNVTLKTEYLQELSKTRTKKIERIINEI